MTDPQDVRTKGKWQMAQKGPFDPMARCPLARPLIYGKEIPDRSEEEGRGKREEGDYQRFRGEGGLRGDLPGDEEGRERKK